MVKAHIQIQPNVDSSTNGKLSYYTRGLFISTDDLDNGSLKFQHYGVTSSTMRKYKNTELYLLPPVLFPSEALDTIDRRYFDYNIVPIVSQLLKLM